MDDRGTFFDNLVIYSLAMTPTTIQECNKIMDDLVSEFRIHATSPERCKIIRDEYLRIVAISDRLIFSELLDEIVDI